MRTPLLMLPKRGDFKVRQRLIRHLYSLRFHLMLWYLLILTLTLCFFSAAIYLLQQSALYNEADSNLQQAIRVLPDLYDPQSGRLVTRNTGIYADMYADDSMSILLDPGGQSIQRIGRQSAPALDQHAIDFLLTSPASANRLSVVGNRTLRFFSTRTPIIDQSAPSPWDSYVFETVTISNGQGKMLNRVLVGLHTDIPAQLAQLLHILLAMTPLALLIAGLGGYWLASRATRPVQMITRTAQEISGTDLHRRLNLRRRDELGELATTFDRMLDRLEGAFERQRQFTADASHELRTPLSIIGTEAERVLQRTHTSAEYIQTVEIINQENQRMTRMVNDLLTLARADQRQAQFQFEQLDLSEIVIEAVERLACQVQQNEIEIQLAHLDELFVRGDRIYLIQLCTNLLDNAIKYSVGFGQQVHVRMDRQQDRARIQISDEGPGIAPECLPLLFERFYRVDQARTHNRQGGGKSPTAGNGLGLSIALWIAQEHGGSIQVNSCPGKGSTFEISLPLETGSSQAAYPSPIWEDVQPV